MPSQSDAFTFPEVGEYWPSQFRIRCCELDYGGSHYHCGECGAVTGMSGHFVTWREGNRTIERVAEQKGITLPFRGFTCDPDNPFTL